MALSSQLGGRVEDPPCVQGFVSLAGQSLPGLVSVRTPHCPMLPSTVVATFVASLPQLAARVPLICVHDLKMTR